MRSDIYEDLKAFAEKNGLKVFTLTNLLVDAGLRMMKEGISPSEVLIHLKVLEYVVPFLEVRPKVPWDDFGKKLAMILKSTYENENDRAIAAIKALDLIATFIGGKQSAGLPRQYSFTDESSSEDFFKFAQALADYVDAKITVEKAFLMVRVDRG